MMTKDEFDKAVGELLRHAEDTLVRKGGEYCLESDRLGAFKRAAAIQGTSQEGAIAGMMAKHIVSIYDTVASGRKMDRGFAQEKIGDAINYLAILYAAEMEGQGK